MAGGAGIMDNVGLTEKGHRCCVLNLAMRWSDARCAGSIAHCVSSPIIPSLFRLAKFSTQ